MKRILLGCIVIVALLFAGSVYLELFHGRLTGPRIAGIVFYNLGLLLCFAGMFIKEDHTD
jgi:ABC-type Fe3+-siderophore transport system permease subunit